MATAVHLRESPNNNPFQFVLIHFHTLAICTRHVGVYSHMHMCVCVCVCVRTAMLNVFCIDCFVFLSVDLVWSVCTALLLAISCECPPLFIVVEGVCG